MSESEQDELFGSETDEEDVEDAPEYIRSPEFQEFAKSEGIQIHDKYGFVQLKTFKPYYFSGQVVRGYAVFTIFNKLKAKDIYFQVKGYEMPGEHTSEVIDELRKNFKKIKGFGVNAS